MLSLAKRWQAYGDGYTTPTVTLKNNICIVDGLAKTTGKWGFATMIGTLPTTCRPSQRLIFNLNNHGKTARVDVLSDGRIEWIAGGNDHGWLSLTGIAFPVGNRGQSKLTLAKDWVPYGHGYQAPTATLKDNICIVEGLAKTTGK